jgi:hypothetical protein
MKFYEKNRIQYMYIEQGLEINLTCKEFDLKKKFAKIKSLF